MALLHHPGEGSAVIRYITGLWAAVLAGNDFLDMFSAHF